MLYYKRPWDDSRGDEFAAWGTSLWYFEVGEDGSVVRQMERYQDGTVLKYDASHDDDHYGGLAQIALEPAEYAAYEITQAEFESAWHLARSLNHPAV